MSLLKLAIEDIVEVQLKFTLKSRGVNKLFTPTLMIRRLEMNEPEDAPEKSVKEFMHANIIGWSDQRLVLDSNDQPAEFSAEALKLFLSAPGVLLLCWNIYIKEVGAKEKN